MKWTIFILIAFVALGGSRLALAGIEDSWDWIDDPVTKKPNRKLKVFIDFDDGTKLGDKPAKDVVKEAIDGWNAVKDQTGWEFVEGGTEADHDIRIKVGTISEFKEIDQGPDAPPRFEDDHLETGGGNTSMSPDPETKRTSKATITLDPEPAEGSSWDTAGTDKETTRNPVSCLMHEFTHTMRLDHQKGKDIGSTKDDPLRSDTQIIKQPQGAGTKGDDVIKPSEKDIEEAKLSSTAPIKITFVPGHPGSDVFVSVPGFAMETSNSAVISLSLPGSIFLDDVNIFLSRTSLFSMPEPFRTPLGIHRMVKGESIILEGEFGAPDLDPLAFFTTRIPYEDINIEIDDLEFGRIKESSLQPFFFGPDGRWVRLDAVAMGGSFSLDTVNNVAEMTLPGSLLTAIPVSGNDNATAFFLSLSGTPVPEPATPILIEAGLIALLFYGARIRNRIHPRLDSRRDRG